MYPSHPTLRRKVEMLRKKGWEWDFKKRKPRVRPVKYTNQLSQPKDKQTKDPEAMGTYCHLVLMGNCPTYCHMS